MYARERNITTKLLAAALTLVLSASCSSIDDDLSDCDTDYKLDYELRLVTNMTTELETQLSTQTELGLAQALRQHLEKIFTDYAHDVDLSFYDTEGAMPRLQHDQHIMNANQASYTLYLPMRQYMHLAAANLLENNLVALTGDDRCPTAVLKQEVRDTISSHTTGLFTARQPMEVLSGVDQTFNVHLYMANCAAGLVIDPRNEDIKDIKVYSTGFASQFNINDSTFVFSPQSPIVRTDVVKAEDTNELCYCSVTFPSKEPSIPTRSVIETTEPFVSPYAEDALWQFRAYVTKKDGSVTQTILGIHRPLRAGQLMIIKGHLTSDGAVETHDPTVGVSVTLDWSPGHSETVPL